MRYLRLVPAFLVDRLPIGWWRPGNHRMVLRSAVHFCYDDHVRTIEWNGRILAQGKTLFPYDHDWK